MGSMWSRGNSSPDLENDLNNNNAARSLVKPKLSRSTCISSSGIRSFLKKSRLYADDTLREKINSERKRGSCTNVINTILMPSWNDRLEVIQYCQNESKLLRQEIDTNTKEKNSVPDFNLRINPYAEEDFQNLQNEKYDQLTLLENWINNEKQVEKIVIGKSLGMLSDVCRDIDFDQFKETLKKENIISQ